MLSTESPPSPPPRSLLEIVVALILYSACAVFVLERSLVDGEVLSACAQYTRNGPYLPEVADRTPIGTRMLHDSRTQFEPWLEYYARRLARDGTTPLWKDTSYCGAPFLANGQSALLYPLHAIAARLGNPDSSRAWFTFFHLVAGALGSYVLLRHLGCGRVAAFLGGATFGFSTFQTVHALHPHVRVTCILPWMLLAVDRFVLRPTIPAGAIVAGLAAWQHLAGHPETTFHVQLTVGVLALVRAASMSGGLRRAATWRLTALAAIPFVAGAMLAAVQLAPFLEYLAECDSLRFRDRPDLWGAISIGAPDLTFLAAAIAGIFAILRMRDAKRPLAIVAFAALLAASVAIGCHASRLDLMEFEGIATLAPDYLGSPNRWRGPEFYWTETGASAGAAWAIALFGWLATPRRKLAAIGLALALLGVFFIARVPLLLELIEKLPVFDKTVNRKLSYLTPMGVGLLAALAVDALPRLRDCPRLALRYGLAFAALLVPILASIPSYEPKDDGHLTAKIAFTKPDRPLDAHATSVTPLPEDDEDVNPTRMLAARSMCGWFALANSPIHGEVEWRTGEHLDIVMTPVPNELRGEDPRMAGVDGPIYAFRLLLPSWLELPDDATYRLVVFDGERNPYRSEWVSTCDRESSLLYRAVPSRYWPIDDRGFTQLLQLLAAFGVGFMLILAKRHGVVATTAAACAWIAIVLSMLLPIGRTIVPSLPKPYHYPEGPSIDALRSFKPQGRILETTLSMMPSEVGAYFGIPDVNGNDAMGPWRIEELLRLAMDLPGYRSSSHQLPTRNATDIDWRLLGVAGVQCVVGAAPEAPDRPKPAQVGLYRVTDRFEPNPNPYWLPRARLVGKSVVAPDDATQITLLTDKTFAVEETVVLASGREIDSGSDVGAAGFHGTTGDSGDQVILDVDVKAPCHLVLADTYFPGWSVTVDGKAREILRANYAFRAVELRPGDQLVWFRYAPDSVRRGFLVSAITGAILALLLLIGPIRSTWTWWRNRAAGRSIRAQSGNAAA